MDEHDIGNDSPCLEAYREIFLRAAMVVGMCQVKEEELDERVSHYTRKSVAEHLIFDDPPTTRWKFGLGFIAGTNDPEWEGKVLAPLIGFKKEAAKEKEGSDITTSWVDDGTMHRFVETREIHQIVRRVCFGLRASGLGIFMRRLVESGLNIECSRSTSRHQGSQVN